MSERERHCHTVRPEFSHGGYVATFHVNPLMHRSKTECIVYFGVSGVSLLHTEVITDQPHFKHRLLIDIKTIVFFNVNNALEKDDDSKTVKQHIIGSIVSSLI